MSPTHFFLTLGLGLGTVIIIFGMRFFVKWAQARAQMAHAATLSDHRAEVEGELKRLEATVADLNARLSHIETILKDVE